MFEQTAIQMALVGTADMLLVAHTSLYAGVLVHATHMLHAHEHECHASHLWESIRKLPSAPISDPAAYRRYMFLSDQPQILGTHLASQLVSML